MSADTRPAAPMAFSKITASSNRWPTSGLPAEPLYQRCCPHFPRVLPPSSSSSASRPPTPAGASVFVEAQLDDLGVDNAFHGLPNCIYCLCHVCCEHVSDGCGVTGRGFEFIRTRSRSPRRRIADTSLSPSRTSYPDHSHHSWTCRPNRDYTPYQTLQSCSNVR